MRVHDRYHYRRVSSRSRNDDGSLVMPFVDVQEVDDSYAFDFEPKSGWRFSMNAAIDS